MKVNFKKALSIITVLAISMSCLTLFGTAVTATSGADSNLVTKEWDFEETDVTAATAGLSNYIKTDNAYTLAPAADSLKQDKGKFWWKKTDGYIVCTAGNTSEYGRLVTENNIGDFDAEFTILGANAGSQNLYQHLVFGVEDATKIIGDEVCGGYSLYYHYDLNKLFLIYNINGERRQIDLLDGYGCSSENYVSSHNRLGTNNIYLYKVKVEGRRLTVDITPDVGDAKDDGLSIHAQYTLPTVPYGKLGMDYTACTESYDYGAIFNIKAVYSTNDVVYESHSFEESDVAAATSGLSVYVNKGDRYEAAENADVLQQSTQNYWRSSINSNTGYLYCKKGNSSDYGTLLSNAQFGNFEMSTAFIGYNDQYPSMFFGVTDPTKIVGDDISDGYKLYYHYDQCALWLIYNVDGNRKQINLLKEPTAVVEGWQNNNDFIYGGNNSYSYTVKVVGNQLTVDMRSECNLEFTGHATYTLPTAPYGMAGVGFISNPDSAHYYGAIYHLDYTYDRIKEVTVARADAPTAEVPYGVVASTEFLPETVTVYDDNNNAYTAQVAWDTESFLGDYGVKLAVNQTATVNGHVKSGFSADGVLIKSEDFPVICTVKAVDEKDWEFEDEDVSESANGLSAYVFDGDTLTEAPVYSVLSYGIGNDFVWKNDGYLYCNDGYTKEYGTLLTDRAYGNFEFSTAARGFTNGSTQYYPSILFGVTDPTVKYGTSEAGGYHLYFQNDVGTLILDYYSNGESYTVNLSIEEGSILNGWNSTDYAHAASLLLKYKVSVVGKTLTVKIYDVENADFYLEAAYELPTAPVGRVGTVFSSNEESWAYSQMFYYRVNDLTETTDGDVNRDGQTDVLDMIRLKKYFADDNTFIDYAAAKLGQNEKLDSDDLAALRKLLLLGK